MPTVRLISSGRQLHLPYEEHAPDSDSQTSGGSSTRIAAHSPHASRRLLARAHVSGSARLQTGHVPRQLATSPKLSTPVPISTDGPRGGLRPVTIPFHSPVQCGTTPAPSRVTHVNRGPTGLRLHASPSGNTVPKQLPQSLNTYLSASWLSYSLGALPVWPDPSAPRHADERPIAGLPPLMVAPWDIHNLVAPAFHAGPAPRMTSGFTPRHQGPAAHIINTGSALSVNTLHHDRPSPAIRCKPFTPAG
jgi:hypothetical protein